MSVFITAIILAAALAHAFWNSLLKKQGDPILNSMMLSTVWIVICSISIPFLPLPHPDSYWIIGLSIGVHLLYFGVLTYTYSQGDFGRVYPIVRGGPPLLVGILGHFFLQETISFYGWLGILGICSGILLLEFGQQLPSRRVFLLSLLTALTVVIYTVVDGVGARLSGNSTSFLMWLSIIQSVIFVSVIVWMRGKSTCINHIARYWKTGLVTGILSLGAYSIILWAMLQTKIAYVSALRETSVLFAGLIAVLFLKEEFRVNRIISALIITAGIILIKLS